MKTLTPVMKARPSRRVWVALLLPLIIFFSISPVLADVVYLYDELGRLVRVIDETGQAATYYYDAVGNLLRITRESNVPQTTTVSSISPSSFVAGTSTTVVITGVNLIGAGVTAGPGVTVTVVQRGEDTLTVKVFVAGNAALGEGSLMIRTDLGTVTLPITIVPNPAAGTITTVAGTGQLIPAFVKSPFGVAVDSQGSLFVADTGNHVVRKVHSDGTSSLVAGSGGLVGGFGGDAGLATSAQLDSPLGVAIDSQGNLFIADTGNDRVRKVSPEGTITTVAGSGVGGFGGDGGPATSAELGFPAGIAVDSQGNLFIADTGNDRVRKVSPEGIITTVAGSGVRGFGGDGGPATSAHLARPRGVAVDSQGNLFIADTENDRVRKVNAEGTITTVAGSGVRGFSGDGGPATSAQLFLPTGLAVDSQGNFFITHTQINLVRKVSSEGTITTVVGTGFRGFSGDGGPATRAQLALPSGLAVDSQGNLLIADTDNHRIRKVIPDGTIRTLVISPPGDGGPASSAHLAGPIGVAVNSQGNLFIADFQSNAVRKVGSDGTITTVAGGATSHVGFPFPPFTGDGGPATSAQLRVPLGVAVDSQGNLFIAESARVRKVSADGTITTVAGNGNIGFYGDGGPATSALLSGTYGIAVDSQGNLFVADSLPNHRIRKVSGADGTITTVAGNGIGDYFNGGFGGDGGPATSAQLGRPAGVALDSQGNLFIADLANNRIRKVSADGVITTVAGTGVMGFGGDGGPATSAQLANPIGVAIDNEGNLLIADNGNSRIRKVSADGMINTVAGTGVAGFSGDGGSPLNADLFSPTGIAVDGLGNFFIADTQNFRVRKVRKVSP